MHKYRSKPKKPKTLIKTKLKHTSEHLCDFKFSDLHYKNRSPKHPTTPDIKIESIA